MVFQLERTSGLTLILAVAFHSLVLPILEESPPIDIARLASLDELNPFRANLARNISVNDRIIEQSLWEQHKSEPNGKKKRGLTIVEYNLKNGGLKKRVDEKNPPIINLKSCLFCEGKAKSTATVDMGDLSAEKLVTEVKTFATFGQCVFYGQRPEGSNPRSLSQKATEYACGRWGNDLLARFTFRTIWARCSPISERCGYTPDAYHTPKQLWPNEGCAEKENYYCLNPWAAACCWLNPIMPSTDLNERKRQALPYFQQMSRAMALACAGDVYILADDIDNPFKLQAHEPTPSIWLTHEAPVLQGLLGTKVVSSLIAIQYSNNMFGAIKKKDVTEDLSKFVPPSGFQPFKREEHAAILPILARKRKERSRALKGNATMFFNENNDIERRATACGAYDQEAPQGDYFG